MKCLALARWFLPFALAMASPAFAGLPALDACLQGLEAEGAFAGSVLVIQGGAPVFRGHYGFRDEAQTRKNDGASVYYTPGVDETILATLVMMARERGLVSLDEPIGTYLPEFRDKPGPRVRDLLAHAGGYSAFAPNTFGDAKPGTLTLAALAAGIAEKPMLAPPGTIYAWKFQDYDLLGYILERVTGKPFPDVLSGWALAPLGIKRSGAGLHSPDQDLAWASRFSQFQADLALWQGGYRPSSSVYANPDELEVFFSALASGRLISADSWRLMGTALVSSKGQGIGLGLGIEPSGVVIKYDNSDWAGYRSLFLYDPRHELRVLLLCNKWMPSSGSSLSRVLRSAIYSALGLKE